MNNAIANQDSIESWKARQDEVKISTPWQKKQLKSVQVSKTSLVTKIKREQKKESENSTRAPRFQARIFEMPQQEHNVIYCDSSYNWMTTVNGRGTGLICTLVKGEAPEFKNIELNFPGLKQLNNRMELAAIHRAIEIAIERQMDFVCILSDSQIAVCWAKRELQKHPVQVICDIGWLPREKNLAGIAIEDQGKELYTPLKTKH